jgi:hypothetical protein
MPFPANLGERTQPAWQAILDWLSDGQWHTHAELVMEAGLASDLSDKSIDELIRKGYRTRHYTRRTSKIPGAAGRVQGAVYQLTGPKDIRP